MRRARVFSALIFLFILNSSCTRAPLKKRTEAMRSAHMPSLREDLELAPFLKHIDAEKNRVEKGNLADEKITFGKRTLSRRDYLLGLSHLQEVLGRGLTGMALQEALEADFEAYEVYGAERWGEVLLTGYYEAELEGARQKTERFSQPLYRTPKDLVDVALSEFDDRFADVGTMRGKIVEGPNKQPTLVPYFPRAAIDGKQVLKGKGLELAWVDPIDSFFLQIQGSGVVHLADGSDLKIRYHNQNGQRYQPIGKFLTDAIPLAQMTQPRLEAHLRSLPPEKAKEVLFKNPSYVFFDILTEGEPITALGTEALGGRTIATDARYFPKGAVGLLNFQKPVFTSETDIEPSSWEEVTRLVLDQDTGGAIRGGGRVDLFFGRGRAAKQAAGVMKNPARLYYLAPNEHLLNRLRTADQTKTP